MVGGRGGRRTYAWTWRKGSCSLVEDIILIRSTGRSPQESGLGPWVVVLKERFARLNWKAVVISIACRVRNMPSEILEVYWARLLSLIKLEMCINGLRIGQ